MSIVSSEYYNLAWVRCLEIAIVGQAVKDVRKKQDSCAWIWLKEIGVSLFADLGLDTAADRLQTLIEELEPSTTQRRLWRVLGNLQKNARK